LHFRGVKFSAKKSLKHSAIGQSRLQAKNQRIAGGISASWGGITWRYDPCAPFSNAKIRASNNWLDIFL
jgi:hypothetical protein